MGLKCRLTLAEQIRLQAFHSFVRPTVWQLEGSPKREECRFKNERLKNHGKEATCKNWQTRKGDCGGIHIQGINETMGDRCAGSRRAMTLKGDNWWTDKE